jgi:transcriptional regulator GlxA family with amidase domain
MISHLDLMIALIERFSGAALAKETARRLAAPIRVSQAPYMSAAAMALGSEELAAFESFIANNLGGTIAVQDAARALNMAARSLSRRVRAVTGLSTRRFIQKIRLNSALHLIEQTRLPMDRVAERVGLADAAVLHSWWYGTRASRPGDFARRKS